MSIQDDTRKFLRKHKMTQGELARLAGVNHIALIKFLSRRNGRTIAERIAPFVYGEIEIPQQAKAERKKCKEKAHDAEA